MTPDELRRRADAFDAEGLRALDGGDQACAVSLFKRGTEYRAAAAALERLQASATDANLPGMLPQPAQPAARKPTRRKGGQGTGQGRAAGAEAERERAAKISAAKAIRGDGDFFDSLRAAGIPSQNALARALGVQSSSVMRWRRKGGWRIPRSAAEAVQRLIGWPADDRHWPNGIREGE